MKFTFRSKEIDLSKKTAVRGILNATPDSFSDGGCFLDPRDALERALMMEAQGADLIDVGAESSRPGAKPVSAEEEISRLVPIIRMLAKRISVPVSIDTYKPRTAKAALDEGADIINDITGLREENGMAELISEYNAGVIIMHMKGSPETMQDDTRYSDVVLEVTGFLKKQAEKALSAGIAPSNILIDPGIGFGKNTQDNLILINSLDRLAGLNFPVFIGFSRKSLIKNLLGPGERALADGAAALTACSVLRGASVIRVHDVESTKRAAVTADALKRAKQG